MPKNHFYVIEKIQKYRKCPALSTTHQYAYRDLKGKHAWTVSAKLPKEYFYDSPSKNTFDVQSYINDSILRKKFNTYRKIFLCHRDIV